MPKLEKELDAAKPPGRRAGSWNCTIDHVFLKRAAASRRLFFSPGRCSFAKLPVRKLSSSSLKRATSSGFSSLRPPGEGAAPTFIMTDKTASHLDPAARQSGSAVDNSGVRVNRDGENADHQRAAEQGESQCVGKFPATLDADEVQHVQEAEEHGGGDGAQQEFRRPGRWPGARKNHTRCRKTSTAVLTNSRTGQKRLPRRLAWNITEANTMLRGYYCVPSA